SGTDNSSLLSTSQILGFADDILDGPAQQEGVGGTKASLLEQLKQRMPWNQPQTSTPSNNTQKQVLTPLQQQQTAAAATTTTTAAATTT
ncbi:hypothetical protein L9F63_026145, partial [Diploptera punctata]